MLLVRFKGYLLMFRPRELFFQLQQMTVNSNKVATATYTHLTYTSKPLRGNQTSLAFIIFQI